MSTRVSFGTLEIVTETTPRGEIAYRENGSYRSALILGVVTLFGAIIYVVGTAIDVPVVGYLGLAIGVYGVIAGVTLAATARHSQVELDQESLRVGRESVALADIDPTLLTEDTLAPKVVADARLPLTVFSSRPALFGGALGTGSWQKVVALRRNDGELLVFGCTDVAQLADALETVADR